MPTGYTAPVNDGTVTTLMTNPRIEEAKLREILAGCEGATPGPWEVRGKSGVFSPGRCVARMDWDIRDAIDDNNAAHIARLDPASVASIITELLERRSPESGEVVAFSAERIALVALIAERDGSEFDGEIHLSSEEGERIVAALSAAIPETEAVAIKPLEWVAVENAGTATVKLQAASVVGLYRVRDRSWWRESTNDHWVDGMLHMTNAHAQAAAQADYETRIRSALTHPVLPDREGFVLVPQSAIDWLTGSGPDANGKWFGEVGESYPVIKSLGTKPPFWWRSHFQKLIAAS